jgi:hypothetical protein
MADKEDAKKAAKEAEKKAAEAKAAEKKAKEEKKGKKKVKKSDVHLPPVLELAYSMPVFLLVAMNVVVAGLSYVSGASLMEIFVRMLVTTFALGLVLWLLVWLLSSYYTPTNIQNNQNEHTGSNDAGMNHQDFSNF